jgi:hypothetical protein
MEGIYDTRHTAASQIASIKDAAVVKYHSLRTESPTSTVRHTSCGIQKELFRKSSSGSCSVGRGRKYMILPGREDPRIVVALGPNSRVGSWSGFIRNWTVAIGLITPKTRTIGDGPVLSIKTQHCKFTIVAPLKYLSSDCMMI